MSKNCGDLVIKQKEAQLTSGEGRTRLHLFWSRNTGAPGTGIRNSHPAFQKTVLESVVFLTGNRLYQETSQETMQVNVSAPQRCLFCQRVRASRGCAQRCCRCVAPGRARRRRPFQRVRVILLTRLKTHGAMETSFGCPQLNVSLPA